MNLATDRKTRQGEKNPVVEMMSWIFFFYDMSSIVFELQRYPPGTITYPHTSRHF